MTFRAGFLAAVLAACFIAPAKAQSQSTSFNSNIGAQSSAAPTAGVSQVGVPRLRPLADALAPNANGYQNPTLRQMIGQMLMVGFVGNRASSPGVRRVLASIRAGDVGGVIYLGPNVSNLRETARMNAAFLSANPALPPLIAIDQEGGQVERLTRRHGFQEIGSAASIARGSPAQASKTYGQLAARLKSLGFNVNLGPVVDVNINPRNPIIARYGRSYSGDPARVTRFASAFVNAHREHGVLTTLKHFPGHGSSSGDSHLGFTNITKTWKDAELEPYRQMIANGTVDMVMSGHLYHSRLNAGGPPRTPASLSQGALGLLRQMSPDVVIITDDLQMGAIRKEFGFEDALIRAVMAGNDILMYTALGENWAALPDRVIRTLEAQAQPGTQLRARIEQSYRRIVAMKRRQQTAAPAARISIMDRPIDFPDYVAPPPRRQLAGAAGAPIITGVVNPSPGVAPVPQPFPAKPRDIASLLQTLPADGQTRYAPIDPVPHLGLVFDQPPEPTRSLLSHQGVKAAMQRLLGQLPTVQPPAIQ
ncbi:MAG: glycoside hydrolase family 3 N-terminal domain-containing protein [Pseudomonadota bacterium]